MLYFFCLRFMIFVRLSCFLYILFRNIPYFTYKLSSGSSLEIKLKVEPAITPFTIRISKSLERQKLAPRSRLKNRKSTSKRQGFFHEKNSQYPKNTKGDTGVKKVAHFFLSKKIKKPRGALSEKQIFSQKRHTVPKITCYISKKVLLTKCGS